MNKKMFFSLMVMAVSVMSHIHASGNQRRSVVEVKDVAPSQTLEEYKQSYLNDYPDAVIIYCEHNKVKDEKWLAGVRAIVQSMPGLHLMIESKSAAEMSELYRNIFSSVTNQQRLQWALEAAQAVRKARHMTEKGK